MSLNIENHIMFSARDKKGGGSAFFCGTDKQRIYKNIHVTTGIATIPDDDNGCLAWLSVDKFNITQTAGHKQKSAHRYYFSYHAVSFIVTAVFRLLFQETRENPLPVIAKHKSSRSSPILSQNF